MSKYHSKKITKNGITYDSIKESRRHQQLLLLERAGAIQDLQRQVKYVLIPTQREPDRKGVRGGLIKGKVIEKECSYYADFVYTENGEKVVEDCKGIKTEVYKIKKKLMLKVHNVRIREV